MTFAEISSSLTYAEPFLWALAFVAFVRAKCISQFPAFAVFLGIRTVGTFVLAGILHAQVVAPGLDGHTLYAIYFYAYQASYLLGYVALFFTLKELFEQALAPLPGLGRIAVYGFKWVAAASLIVAGVTVLASLPSVSQDARYNYIFSQVADGLCIFELCLLAFLTLAAHALGLSFRSRVFGISLGFGMMAAMELVANALHSDLNAWPNEMLEIVMIVALAVWIVYLAKPEPARQQLPQMMSAKLLHWNDLAMALGSATSHQGTTTENPGAQAGFLQDVEGVVDRVLAKNSVNNTN